MHIRDHTLKDSATLLKLFHDTVHNINIKDYTQTQIDAWAPDNFDLTRWESRTRNYKIFVAEDNKGIAGFAELDIDGHIDCFYVHHERQGQGVGKLLIEHVEKEALRQNFSRIFAEVSITAKPFFERSGFIVLTEQQAEIRGQKLTNFRMEKLL
ncbi:GNAT family N-acetyltransferase [Kiloniella antarctica]|uniref:GNAT family N-acetyltransferase n=1 Tax=Kiloniella antarctica TaxID=1550907 RepID=A0ABW5BQ07_9PROT